MTEDTSPENLRKFLESDDPAIVLMGLSMAKGSGYPNEIQENLLSLALFNSEDSVRIKALESVKELGLEKKYLPEKTLWIERIYYQNQKSTRENYGREVKNELNYLNASAIEPVIKTILAMEGGECLFDIAKKISQKLFSRSWDDFADVGLEESPSINNIKLILKGITDFCDKDKCIEFYDKLLWSTLGMVEPVPSFYAQESAGYVVGFFQGSNIIPYYLLNVTRALPLMLIFNSYTDINAQEKYEIIFSKSFWEINQVIIDKGTNEQKQGDLWEFVKPCMEMCIKLDKKNTLLKLETHLLSGDRGEKIAAAQVFEMLYNSNPTEKKLQKRIFEIVEPVRKHKLGLVRSALKAIK